MLKTESPLVSIIVITYNSSKFIIETLESARKQTYRNIELIISDDCSQDNTVSVCKNWLGQYGKYFKKVTIVESRRNTGVAPNCNRGINAAEGEWIKLIAGDDILLEDCISKNLAFTRDYKGSFFFSKLRFTNENIALKDHFDAGYRLFNSNLDQLGVLLKTNCLPAASSFMNRMSVHDLGGFDERYPMVEDYPFWLKVAKANYKIRFLDEETVIYRTHPDTLSQNTKSIDEQLFYKNLKFWDSMNSFGRDVLVKEQVKGFKILKAYTTYLEYLKFQVVKKFNNKRNFLSLSIINSLSLLHPSFYFKFFLKLKKY